MTLTVSVNQTGIYVDFRLRSSTRETPAGVRARDIQRDQSE